jgi:hypothetical protein
MRNLLILIFASLLTSCGSTYKLSTLNHDPNYHIEGTDVQVDVIDNDLIWRESLGLTILSDGTLPDSQ